MNAPATPAARPPMTLDEIADTTAALIREARAAGLPEACSVSGHDWSVPEASLYLSATDHPRIWTALRAWASHYGTSVTTRATTSTDRNTHAYAEFRYHGLRVQVASVISPDDDPADEGEDEHEDQGEDQGQ